MHRKSLVILFSSGKILLDTETSDYTDRLRSHQLLSSDSTIGLHRPVSVPHGEFFGSAVDTDSQ